MNFTQITVHPVMYYSRASQFTWALHLDEASSLVTLGVLFTTGYYSPEHYSSEHCSPEDYSPEYCSPEHCSHVLFTRENIFSPRHLHRAYTSRGYCSLVLFTQENTVHSRILPLGEPFPQRTTLPAKDSTHPSTWSISEHNIYPGSQPHN